MMAPLRKSGCSGNIHCWIWVMLVVGFVDALYSVCLSRVSVKPVKPVQCPVRFVEVYEPSDSVLTLDRKLFDGEDYWKMITTKSQCHFPLYS